jgi:hypothetical protein
MPSTLRGPTARHSGAASALSAILKGVGDPWSGLVDDELVAEAERHDLAPLIYHALRVSGAWERQPVAARHALAQMAAAAAIVEEFSRRDVHRVLEALANSGVSPLLFKGAALANRTYARPWLRPRLDTDLLIREEEVDAAAAAFEQLGFSRVLRPIGEHVTHQFAYRTSSEGVCLEYDVHWKIADPQLFADILSYDELAADAAPLPTLGPAARAIGDVHALVVACTHRVAHHYDTGSLLWLYDIALLARTLDESQWSQFIRLTSEKRIRRVCARGLALAAELFGAPAPSALWDAHEPEPTAAYLRTRLRRVDILRSDLRTLTGWRARAKLIREHLFPRPSYILQSYGQTHRLALPVLYLHRIVSGAVDWFRPLR